MSRIPANGLAAARLPRSERVLLLVDFMNPMDFPGGENLPPAAVEAARATAALKHRLAGEGVITIYANDNYGVWQSDFHTLVSACLATDMCVQLTEMDAFLREYPAWVPADCTAAEFRDAKETSLAYMASILKADTRPAASSKTPKPPATRKRRRAVGA